MAVAEAARFASPATPPTHADHWPRQSPKRSAHLQRDGPARRHAPPIASPLRCVPALWRDAGRPCRVRRRLPGPPPRVAGVAAIRPNPNARRAAPAQPPTARHQRGRRRVPAIPVQTLRQCAAMWSACTPPGSRPIHPHPPVRPPPQTGPAMRGWPQCPAASVLQPAMLGRAGALRGWPHAATTSASVRVRRPLRCRPKGHQNRAAPSPQPMLASAAAVRHPTSLRAAAATVAVLIRHGCRRSSPPAAHVADLTGLPDSSGPPTRPIPNCCGHAHRGHGGLTQDHANHPPDRPSGCLRYTPNARRWPRWHRRHGHRHRLPARLPAHAWHRDAPRPVMASGHRRPWH